MCHQHAILLSAVIILIQACSAGDAATDVGPPESNAQPSFLPADEVILGKVYAPEVSTPDHFFRDSAYDMTGAFTLRHVRSVDVDRAAPIAFELCADSLTDAMALSAAADAVRPVPGTLVTAGPTSRYFEMTRTVGERFAIERVFRCTYLSRAGVDATTPFGPAGQINERPLSRQALKALAEYLWQFSVFNNPGHAVLASESTDASTGLRHTITVAALTRHPDQCDQVDVFDWYFDADPDGQLHTSEQPIVRLTAQSNAGIVSVCTP